MPHNPRYDILFEPVQIGPVRTRSRFFQVPHCNGMGHQMPAAHAAMREVKADGTLLTSDSTDDAGPRRMKSLPIRDLT